MRTRILTALVLIPGTIAALFFLSPPEWAAITLAIVALASSEWAHLAGIYAQEIQELEELLGWDCSQWRQMPSPR